VAAGRYTVAIDFTLANQLAGSIYGRGWAIMTAVVASTPLLVAVIAVVGALISGQYWLLAAIPSSFLTPRSSGRLAPPLTSRAVGRTCGYPRVRDTRGAAMSAFYKFIADPAAARSILQGILRFTPIRELNDPSELAPSLNADEVLASLARLRANGYSQEDMIYLHRQGNLLQKLAPRFQAIPVPVSPEAATTQIRSPFYDALPTLERLLAATAEEISSRVGLLCLSRRYDALPMWAHYTGNATGLVVEFRNLELAFPGDDTGF
jgi:hypothetical protein